MYSRYHGTLIAWTGTNVISDTLVSWTGYNMIRIDVQVLLIMQPLLIIPNADLASKQQVGGVFWGLLCVGRRFRWWLLYLWTGVSRYDADWYSFFGTRIIQSGATVFSSPGCTGMAYVFHCLSRKGVK